MVGDVFEYIPDRPGDDTVECRIITGTTKKGGVSLVRMKNEQTRRKVSKVAIG